MPKLEIGASVDVLFVGASEHRPAAIKAIDHEMILATIEMGEWSVEFPREWLKVQGDRWYVEL